MDTNMSFETHKKLRKLKIFAPTIEPTKFTNNFTESDAYVWQDTCLLISMGF